MGQFLPRDRHELPPFTRRTFADPVEHGKSEKGSCPQDQAPLRLERLPLVRTRIPRFFTRKSMADNLLKHA